MKALRSFCNLLRRLGRPAPTRAVSLARPRLEALETRLPLAADPPGLAGIAFPGAIGLANTPLADNLPPGLADFLGGVQTPPGTPNVPPGVPSDPGPGEIPPGLPPGFPPGLPGNDPGPGQPPPGQQPPG